MSVGRKERTVRSVGSLGYECEEDMKEREECNESQ